MLKVNLEFRKGVLFVRLNGNLNSSNVLDDINILVNDIGLKYIVFNLDKLNSIDLSSISWIMNYNNKLLNNNGKLLLCESDDIISNHLFKNKIPYIRNEIQAFNLI